MKKKDIKDFYRWEYLLNMYKNANGLVRMLKYILLILLVPLTYILINTWFENILYIFKMFMIFSIVLSVMCIIFYIVYALINKGIIHYMYEMTSRGIDILKIKSDKKTVNEKVKSNINDVIRGRNISNLSHKYISFNELKEIVVNKKDSIVELKSPLSRSEVHAKEFDFVLKFILNNIDSSVKVKYKKEK